ncbi:MAG TPA: Glu-tRNA(Gln) amidotransferase subunit GatE [Gemmatimonadales bacterium]
MADPRRAPGIRAPTDVNPRTEPVLDFPDAPFGTLTSGDYDAIGFLGGLEVHQQVRTRSKLFCRCPAGRNVTRYDAEVLRHMRPTLSELGEYDGTALMEFKTRKEIVYQLDRGSVCTYEIDDTPPFEIDDEAVDIAIELAQLLNLNLVSELHVMRKQYLDGSIPTGFQRTAMVGLTGSIPFVVPELGVARELRIRQLSLEEDSCREVSDIGHRITFRTDRLGMPLTEAVTEPDLYTPFEVRAAGRLLADVARVTGKVRRGPGAARQDVNVSVAGGRRIEIKGVHHHRGLPCLVHIEAFRQLNLLRIRAELHRRGVTAVMLALPENGRPWEVSPLVVEAGSVLRSCDFDPIRQARERGDTVCAARVPGFGGLLSHRTQPGVTFAQEFDERVRVIACPVHRPFLIHSDLGEYGLRSSEWLELRKQLGAGTGDAVVLVWGSPADAATAVREVFLRAQDALIGIPSETRQAHPDGTTGFERILPGADRMYPDTDTPPIPIPDATVNRIRAQLPETPWDRSARYRDLGLTAAAAERMTRAWWADAFDAAAPATSDTARRLAASLAKRLPYHRRVMGDAFRLDGSRLGAAARVIEQGSVRREALDRMIDALVRDPGTPAGAIVARYARQPDDEAVLDAAVHEAARGVGGLITRSPDATTRWAMGQVMRRYVGRIDPAVARARLDAVLARRAPETVA